MCRRALGTYFGNERRGSHAMLTVLNARTLVTALLIVACFATVGGLCIVAQAWLPGVGRHPAGADIEVSRERLWERWPAALDQIYTR